MLQWREEEQEVSQRFDDDIGKEDLLLGYPWLANYEPRFSWRHATIDEKQLPIVLRSVNPNDRRAVLARLLQEEDNDVQVSRMFTREDKKQITTELKEQVYGRRSAVELAIDAKQYTKTVNIPKEYQQFAKVFGEEEAKRFPPKRSCDHAIEFKKGAPEAIDCKVYPMTRVEDAALDDFIDEQIEKGYIRPSKSPYASSFFFIKKKDGKLRPVQDYRKINEWTIRNQYPLPLINDLIKDLGGAQIFSKLDVRQGYNNIRIKEGDEHKAAFKTRRGLFEPTVMYFGLCNSPATFQSFMNEIYRPIIAKHEALGTTIRVYMDDIAIATKRQPARSNKTPRSSL